MQQETKIYTNDRCVGCNLCITNCPCDEANIAVMENGSNKIYIDPEKCIVCGNCIRNCTHNAREYIDDTERFFRDIASGKEIALIAAPALRTNFDDYERLLGYLRSLGLVAIYDTSFGADICTWGYLRHMAASGKTGIIAQPCPSIVNYVERYAPDLLSRLSPVHSPAMCTAIYMKKYRHIAGSLAFLSPCIAKRDEFADANTYGMIEYNVTFRSLKAYLDEKRVNLSDYPSSGYDNEPHGLGAVYPMPGGLKANVEQYVGDAWIHQVEGQPHVCHFLQAYREEDPATAPFLVDILNCEHGCNIGTGALRDETESLAVGRALHRTKAEMKARTKRRHIPGPDFKRFDRELTLGDFLRAYREKPVMPIPINASDIESAFLKLRKVTDADRRIDCCSCGYISCRHMAEAVAKKINHVENCVEYFRSVLSEQRQRMEMLALERDRQARELRASVENILVAINESTRQTDSTKSEVEGINDQAGLLGDIAARLGKHVAALQKEIQRTVKMNDEIVGFSRQTIILALNASIEAARAGQVGRGFAIVAEQIKHLSDQSQRSAQSAIENNEIIAPLLRMVGDVSDEVASESHIITDNVANIRSAVDELYRVQHEISIAAENISASGSLDLLKE